MSRLNVKLGVVCTILSAIFYGVTPILVKIVQQTGVTPLTIVFYRNFFCICIVTIVSVIKRQKLLASPSEIKKFSLLALTGPILATLCLYSSYQYIAVGTATVLNFLYPVCAAVIMAVFFREKIGRNRIISLIVACIGLAFFINPGENSSQIGVALAVFSAMIYGIYIVLMEKLEITKYSPQKVAFYLASATSIFMLGYGLITDDLTLMMTPYSFFLCIIIAFLTSYGAILLLQVGIRNLNAITASILCLFEPVSGFVCGMLILNEVVTTKQWIGSVVIMLALVAAFAIPSEKKKQAISN